jgi:hypothetical protein
MEEATQTAMTLNGAIAAGPAWLRAWVGLLILSHVAALPFGFWREERAIKFRPECAAIFVSFIAAAITMNWLHETYGYVRLLGLAHLIFWTPAFVWVMSKRAAIGSNSWYGRYIHAYLLIAGTSLVIDTIDVIRYAFGDTGV